MRAEHHGAGYGRLFIGVGWLVLLLGLWLWGSGVAGNAALSQLTATGDVAAVGRPLGAEPPRTHAPIAAPGTVRPSSLTIPALGIRAGLIARGLDADGAVIAPPAGAPGRAGWYADGPQPGAAGAAVLAGRSAGGRGRAAFAGLTTLRPGAEVDVRRSDGSTARFTVEDVQVFPHRDFDPRKVYGAHEPGRAELRLVTRGASAGSARDGGPADVVVSAYLSGYAPGRPAAG
ncbi:sortase domain-containing protein [Streptomyces pinistramenti]|uniref:sortase domain-containing protein n=1 Tax=Streptomyces pinistramenti TaxID=2884812 RepID=UPI001D0731F4|nr:sortase [Streptomyces pinistramenti]MCB5910297.1 sortase [Streptomyces pinistramenti]